MTREVDPAKTARALRKLRQAIERAEAEGRELSTWERDFASSLEDRLETFGSAFRDRTKGEVGEALSRLQTQKLGEIAKKAKTGASPWPARKPIRRSKRAGRQTEEAADARYGVSADDAPVAVEPPAPSGRPKLRLISGGRDRSDD